ncbi:MAG TPA: LysM peptidoglycan-binding domain-containing protein [Tepidisphaeraceae bacterium]|jgi:5'-nucleotidase
MSDKTFTPDMDVWLGSHEGIHMTHIVALLFILAIGLIVGCGSKDKMAVNDGVLDVSKSPAPVPSAEPLAAPAQPEAVAYTAPAAPEPVAAPAASPAAKTYTVKKGDTLFSIAKTNYGTGKEWQKIASANPGLKPATLKAGQKINLP